MNAARLREVADLLLDLEAKLQTQNLLSEANDQLARIVHQPQQPQFQTELSRALEQLRHGAERTRELLQPAQIELIDEIGGKQFFVEDIAATIDEWLKQNAVTPAVAQQKLQELLTERQAYISHITQLRNSLKSVGIEAVKLEPGEAEIGFMLPRMLFNNDFEDLISELKELDFIMRAFSELAFGSVEKFEVRQISTSDPQFFFGMSPDTIAFIGAAVTWALHTWKQVEEIRKLRADTRKLDAFSETEIERFFGEKIKETLSKAVESQTEELFAKIKTESGRAYEQGEHIKKALESLLARVERGMTVEIRALPPSEDSRPEEITAAYAMINDIKPKLVFPAPEQNPILPLPKPEETK